MNDFDKKVKQMKMTPEQKIIHDLNGHLFVIQGHAEMLKEDLDGVFLSIKDNYDEIRKDIKALERFINARSANPVPTMPEPEKSSHIANG